MAPLRDSILVKCRLCFGVWGPFENLLAIKPKQLVEAAKKFFQNNLMLDIPTLNRVPKVKKSSLKPVSANLAGAILALPF